MSRTYRLRHLPRIKARKFIDAHPGKFYGLHGIFEELVDERLRELYPSAFRANGRIKLTYWSHRRAISDSMERDFLAPVANTSMHPWVPWWRNAPVKSWYKENGNRRVRRHNRAVVHSFAHLGDEVDEDHRFLTKRDGWDLWSLY